MLRRTLLVLLAATALGLLLSWRLDAAREADGPAAAEATRLRGWARAEGGAGPSVLPKRVPEADPGELRRFEDHPGFHDYAMRCSSCHALPDPGAYPAKRWIGKVDEMKEHVDRAGLMPPTDAQIEAVVEFLGDASAALR